MRKSTKMLAIGAAAVAGPLLATAASTISGYISFEDSSPNDDFSLDEVFVGSGESGSASYQAQSDGAIIVWGWSGGGYNTDNNDDPGGGGDGDGDTSTREPYDTPCVEALPAGINMVDINRAAMAASKAIAALNDETFEYGSIIWLLDG
jgi:hypothetical protein